MDQNSTLFKKALNIINASGAQYRIIMPDGTHFGTLPYAEPKPEKAPRRKLKHPYGALRAHYLPFVADIKPGECIDVPCGPFTVADMQGAISSYFCAKLGNGKVTVARNRERKCVEVLRVE
jgi:hypothetical protein